VVSADYSPIGASTYTVQAYFKGALTAQATGQKGTSLAQAQSACGSFDWELWPNFGPTVDWDNGGTPLLLGGASVMCDQLYIIPENVTWSGAPTAMQITASQVPGLTITSENASLVYQGLTNSSLGNATLAVSGSQLVVSNLGSSGQDGVSIALPGNLSAWEAHWQDPDPSGTLPVGAYVQQQVMGPGSAGSSGVLGTVAVTKAGTGNYVVSADFSAVGASTYTVQAYRQGVLVAQATGQTGSALAVAANFSWSNDSEVSCCPWSVTVSVDWGSGGTSLSVAGAKVTCDQLYIIPENASWSGAPTAMQITASQVPGLTITSENASLVYQGLTNSSLGNATLAVSGSQLVVSNLGSSGQDGVAIALPGNLSGLEAHWQNPDPSGTLPVGAYLKQQVVGPGRDGTSGVLGMVAVTKAGTSNYVVSADFSPVGVSTYTVQAYRQGVLVAQASGQPGAALAVASGCSWSGDIGWTCCPLIVDVSVDWGSGGTSLAVAGAKVTCDHLYITPEGVSLPSQPTAFQITGAMLPPITITSENVTLPYGGLSHTSLGNATVAVQGNQLSISNLGSSGQDGVSIALPGTLTGLEMHWQDPDPLGALPVGAYLKQQVVGPASDGTSGVLGALQVTKAGTSNYVVSADFSPVGASTYTVQAYRQGVMVAQASGQKGAAMAVASGCSWSGDITYTCCPWSVTVSLDWGSGGTSLLVAGAKVTCDQLYIIPENVAWQGAPTAMQITASQVPALSMTAATVSPVLVSLSLANQNATLQWFGTGVLQQTSDLRNWSDVSGATTPYTIPMSGTNQFFRITQPTSF
jgi:hypothetical protein